jgi:glycosyltransferase involved in cell wall biosynthesis
MKKVFIVTGGGSLGGHNRTAFISALEMKRRGYEIHIITGGTTEIYNDINNDIPVIKLQTDYINSIHFLKIKTIYEFWLYAKRHKPDMIHVFDEQGLVLGYYYSLIKGIKLVHTICGGPVARRYYYANMRPIIVFSDEQYNGYVERGYYNRENMFISPGRVDLDFKTFSSVDIVAYKEKLQIPKNKNIILMISRIHNGKRKSINHFINIVKYTENKECCHFLLVGMNEDNSLYKIILKEAELINNSLGFKILTITEKGSNEARKLLSMAKIAIGIGRTAYEAMSKGVPTLVIGEYGFAGLTEGNNCDHLAKYNFSGRNAQNKHDEDRSEYKSYSLVKKLLTDEKYYKTVSDSGKQWVENNMDIRNTGEIYESIYNKNYNEYKLPNVISIKKIIIYHFLKKYYYWMKSSIIPNNYI